MLVSSRLLVKVSMSIFRCEEKGAFCRPPPPAAINNSNNSIQSIYAQTHPLDDSNSRLNEHLEYKQWEQNMAETTAHPSKRRRLDSHGSHSHESSSDELGANSDVERRRASWLQQVRTTYQSPRPAFKPTPRLKKTAEPIDSDRDDDESPDELTVVHETHNSTPAYWRRQSAARNGARSTSRESSRGRRSDSERRRRREQEDRDHDRERERERDDGEDDEREESSEDASEDDDEGDGDRDGESIGDAEDAERPVQRRTPSPPPPPPPPPKPERLYYRETLVLRGHQRGVAAVQFSPDGSMIASCCKL